ncbi:MAG TPA: hypothetical protein VGC84_19225 [Ilumatobacteraceae bacterium]|jgi:hypothetical protein
MSSKSLTVHSILPPLLTATVDRVLIDAAMRHVAHGDANPVQAAAAAATDPQARVVIGPCRSRDVAEALEVTAPAGLAMIAPIATWAGVTRDDEPGCEDHPARGSGTVFRLVARDSVVAQRIATRVRDAGHRAVVIAGDHEYGVQLDAQLAMSGLPRVSAADADVIVLAGLAGHEEIARARSLAPLPIIAFDGVQPERFPRQQVLLTRVYAVTNEAVGTPEARRAAELAVAALVQGGNTSETLRELGGFDDHGDLLDPDVRFESY